MTLYEKIKLNAAELFNGDVPPDEALRHFAEFCEAGNFNPFTREVYLIKIGKIGGKWTPFVGIDALRKRAASTGRYLGGRPLYLVQGETAFREIVDPSVHKVAAVRWEAYLKGAARPSACDAFAIEYKGSSKPWQNHPIHMLTKVAEAKALRAFFPEVNAGAFTEEEVRAWRAADEPEPEPTGPKSEPETAPQKIEPETAPETPKKIEPEPTGAGAAHEAPKRFAPDKKDYPQIFKEYFQNYRFHPFFPFKYIIEKGYNPAVAEKILAEFADNPPTFKKFAVAFDVFLRLNQTSEAEVRDKFERWANALVEEYLKKHYARVYPADDFEIPADFDLDGVAFHLIIGGEIKVDKNTSAAEIARKIRASKPFQKYRFFAKFPEYAPANFIHPKTL